MCIVSIFEILNSELHKKDVKTKRVLFKKTQNKGWKVYTYVLDNCFRWQWTWYVLNCDIIAISTSVSTYCDIFIMKLPNDAFSLLYSFKKKQFVCVHEFGCLCGRQKRELDHLDLELQEAQCGCLESNMGLSLQIHKTLLKIYCHYWVSHNFNNTNICKKELRQCSADSVLSRLETERFSNLLRGTDKKSIANDILKGEGESFAHEIRKRRYKLLPPLSRTVLEVLADGQETTSTTAKECGVKSKCFCSQMKTVLQKIIKQSNANLLGWVNLVGVQDTKILAIL